MIEIDERITRVTTSSGAPAGIRVTLEFSRSAPLSQGQEVRWRYDFAGDGHFLDCVGIPQPTHIVARRGQLAVFHYRLSHWITQRDIPRAKIAIAATPELFGEVPAADPTPA